MSTSHSESVLANLRTLLDVNAQMARERPADRLECGSSDEVHDVIEDVFERACGHRDALERLIADWESHVRRSRPVLQPSVEARLSPRELIESWLAIKEVSAELYRRAAELAPTPRIRRGLDDLAREEDALGRRLRALL